MADPRLYQTFKCETAAKTEQSAARAFGNAAGKIGDLEVLNSIGAGKVGQGLRTLASISNTLQTGCGSLPSTVTSSIESGANWVLGNMGMSADTVSAVSKINTTVANTAWGQAKSIYSSVTKGNFKMSDIPGVIQDMKNLERLGSGIFTSSANVSGKTVTCDTSPYAVDLMYRAPKHKFMFVVQFTFNTGYVEGLTDLDFSFVIKRSTRPNVKFQMDDVNYYNFRTKQAVKTEYEEMSMTFYDDMTNKVTRFIEAYRRAVSPVANMDENTFFLDPENSGMNFTDNGTDNVLSDKNLIEHQIKAGYYTGSRGGLADDNTNVIRFIKLFHVYDAGHKANVYTFMNPRISTINQDEVDMSVSEASEVTLQFNYDSVYVEMDKSLEELLAGGPIDSRSAIYPLQYNGSSEVMVMNHNISNGLVQQATGATQPSCDNMSTQDTGFSLSSLRL